MAESNEGTVRVDIRKKWPNEAYDFTPWLADNLDVLGDALGLKLEPVQQEKQVGSFSLDILAREVNENAMVAIENQLEWTDHGHLGQLLTYAAGCDASIAIWVADEFQYEHARALHRLNEWAGNKVRFYGVKVDAERDGDTAPLTPKLRKVIYPGGWDEALTLPTPPPPDPETERLRQKYLDFFQPLISTLQGVNLTFADKTVNYFNYTGRFFPSRVDPAVGYAPSFCPKNNTDYAWVTFNIRLEDTTMTKRLYDALEAEKEQIQSSIEGVPGSAWQWDRYDRFLFSSISMCKTGSIDDPPEQLEATRQWMLDLLPKFKDVFEDRVERLLTNLRTPHGDGPQQP